MKLRPILTVATVIGLAAVLFLPADMRAAETVALGDIGTICIGGLLDDCKVLTGGYLNISDFGEASGEPYLAWQTQLGSTPLDGVIGGFVLLEHGADGWTILDSAADGFFEVPRLNQDGLLHVPGYGQGTGAFNTDRLYQWGDQDGWNSVDVDTWLGEIAPMLPDGLEIWKGVDYDFSNPWSGLVARTALWRSDDANCCPSGGSAVITLDIVDQKLVATQVDYQPPAKTK